MANQPHDREDLLREATALVERAEFTVMGDEERIVIGFRPDGSLSAFLGVDPVYQFNSDDQLRRAYRHGFLYKSERGRLVRLERRRTTDVVELLRHDLTDEEQAAFLAALVQRMTELRDRLGRGRYQMIGQVPAGANVMGRIQKWLDGFVLPPPIALSPGVGDGE